MEPRYHFISSVMLAFILSGYFGIYSVFIFVGGFLIDVDHYLFYIFNKKDISLKRCLNFYHTARLKLKYLNELHIFHTVEFWFMMIVLSFYYKFILATFIGMVLHQSLDSYDHHSKKLASGRVKSIYGYLLGMKSQSYKNYLKIKTN